MPAERVSMRRVREILRLKYECGASDRAIAVAIGLARSTVRLCLDRVAAAGLIWPLPATLTDASLEALLFAPLGGSQPGKRRKDEPDWTQVHHELRRPGVTLLLLWEEYRAAHPGGYGYSRWCELYRGWEGRLSPTMRQAHPAGERLFVDYAGQTVEVVGRQHRRIAPGAGVRRGAGRVELHLRRGDLDARACPTGSASHVRALEFLGGVPRQIVPDNLRVGRAAGELVRAGHQPDLPRSRDALRHGDPADAGAAAARQGESRGRCAGRRALDPGATAQSALLLACRAERRDRELWWRT